MLRNIRQQLQKQQGFTLVELVVVIAIIGILAAIAVPKFTSATDSAKGAKVQADLRTVDSAIALVIAETGSTPSDGELSANATVLAKLSTTSIAPATTFKVGATNYTCDGKYYINSGRAAVKIETDYKTVEQL